MKPGRDKKSEARKSKIGGYRSRKMVMAYVTMLMGSLGYISVGRWPALAVVFTEYCMFLLGAATIYSGSNTAVKWMAARVATQKVAADPEMESAAAEEHPRWD